MGIHNQHQTIAIEYEKLAKPHELSGVSEILEVISSLKSDEGNMLRLYHDTVHAIQLSKDVSEFESCKNRFSLQSNRFQQNLTSHHDKIKEIVREEERKQQKIKIMNNQDKKCRELNIK